MGVNLSDLFHKEQYHTGTQKSTAAGADAAADKNTGDSAQGTLRLQPGQQFRATVISVNGDRVSIQTQDHTVFSAKLDSHITIENGAVLNFEVRGVQGNQISLTPLYSNLDQDSSIFKALQAAELPVTEACIRMVNEMMSQGMGIDRQSLQSMYHMLSQYDMEDFASLVRMKQLDISVSPENLIRFQCYENNTAQIINGYEEIGEGMLQLMQGMAAEKDYEGLGRIFVQAMGLVQGEAVSENGSTAPRQSGEPADAVNGNTVGKQIIAENLTGVSGPDMAGTAVRQTGQFPEKDGLTGSAVTDNAADKTVKESQQISGGGQADGLPQGGEQNSRPGTALAGSAQDALLEALRQAEENEHSGAGQKAAGSLESDAAAGTAAIPPEGTERAEKELQSLLEAFVKKDGAFQGTDGTALYREAGERLAELIRNTYFGEAFKKKLSGEWLLKPQEVSKKEQVQALYEKVLRQTAGLKEILAQEGKGDSAAMKSIQSMAKQVEFLNELNQNFAYVQLPLKMSGRNAHGDLYVYTKKKSFSSGDGAVTALLHLEMEHLGNMDIYVALMNQKVSTKFYLESEELITFLEGHMDELDSRLMKKGYAMHAELLHKDHKDTGNVFEELLKDNRGRGRAPAVLLSHQSFDVRA